MRRFDRPLVSLVFRIPKKAHQAVKDLSKKTRISQSEYLREALEDLLKKYQSKLEEP
jgi:predicted DNA-binding protein